MARFVIKKWTLEDKRTLEDTFYSGIGLSAQNIVIVLGSVVTKFGRFNEDRLISNGLSQISSKLL
jgi:hypothetical protein